MNPTSNETAGFQLPVPEQIPDAGAGEAAPDGAASPERAAAPVEKAPSSANRPPSPGSLSPISLPPPPASATTTAADDASMAQSLTASVVDDGDLIEKEWVSKAKQIVERNRNDPYKQSEELTIFRANYMKKHYNKDIKLSK